MSHWVAVEWDDRTLRVLCVRPSAGTLTIEHRFSLPLPEVDGEASSPAGLPAAFLPRLAGALAPALAERGIRRGELLVAMGRSGVELRTIEVPVVPEDELPDLVRMQASQVFHPSATPLPIDYVPIDFGEEKIAVLAASIAPDVYEGLKGLAEALKLKLGCVTLRTVSAARLLAYCGRHPGESLVICRSQEQVDLVAMLEGRPVFVRNTRIPGESIDAGLALEVRRTLLAIASRHSDENVDRLVLWGSEAESGGIARTLRERLSMEVEVLDPFKAEDVQSPGLPPVDDAGAYASLVGMLCEHRRPPHAIDFHNPKRRVEPSKISPRMMLYAGAGAAFVLILVSVFGWRFWSLTSEIASLQEDVKKLETLKKKADEVVDRAEWVRTWTEDDYVWLEELRVVSERLPPPDKALVRSWTSSVDADGVGTINLDVLVDDTQTVADAEYRHRDERRQIVSGAVQPNDNVPGYPYGTRATITMADPVPPDEEEAPESVDPPTFEPRSAGSPIDPLSEEAADPVDEVEAMLAEEEATDVSSAAAPTANEDSTGPESPTADEPNEDAANEDESPASEADADEPAGDAPAENDAPLESSAAPSSTPSSTGAGR